MQNRSFAANLKKGASKRLNELFKNPYAKVGLGRLKIKKLKHLPPGRLRTEKFFNIPFSFIAPAEFLHGVKEIFVKELYKQDLPALPYIIDCGANIGLSVVYLKQRHPDARIVAFEPDQQNFQLLKTNVESFKYKDISLRQEAVWTENTELRFAGPGSMSSRIDLNNTQNKVKIVKAARLKDLLTEQVDFLKIDIEGAEFEVLKDIKDNLHPVNNMFLEYHGSFDQTSQLTQIFDWLGEKGFFYYIKEAANVFPTPFERNNREGFDYDIQLNIFCFRS